MEYAIVGSVLSLLLSMKFTKFSSEKQKADYQALVERVEKLETEAQKKTRHCLRT